MNLKIITLISSLFCITSFAGSPSVIIETNHGSISIELNEKKAPLTVKNFIGYVEKKYISGPMKLAKEIILKKNT